MKYKKTIVGLTTALLLSFCFLSLSTGEAAAQTRKKKTVGKITNKRKPAPKKTVVKVVPLENLPPGANVDATILETPKKRPDATPRIVSLGVVNGKALSLVQPLYPPAARAVRASGAVNIQVTIDEQGSVVSASAVNGHPLLRKSAEEAALASTFRPVILEGKPVRGIGVIVYNFIAE